MELNLDSSFFIPDAVPQEEALARTTHLGVVAHPDDLEIAAFHGIIQKYKDPDKWFAGLVCTHGGETAEIRKLEQNTAALEGQYAFVAHLSWHSHDIKHVIQERLVTQISEWILKSRPEIVYTHTLFDRHDTHVSVAKHTLLAIARISKTYRPEKVYGCEVWRSLDWLPTRISLDVSGYTDLALKLVQCFTSQIEGGKKYDLATLSRRQAHATFSESHAADQSSEIILAEDLTHLIDTLDFEGHVEKNLKLFKHELLRAIEPNTSPATLLKK